MSNTCYCLAPLTRARLLALFAVTSCPFGRWSRHAGRHRDGSLYLLDMTRLALEKDLPVKQVTVQTIRAHEYGVVALCQSKKHRLMFSAGVFRVRGSCGLTVSLVCSLFVDKSGE